MKVLFPIAGAILAAALLTLAPIDIAALAQTTTAPVTQPVVPALPPSSTVINLAPVANTLIEIAASVLAIIVPLIAWHYWRLLAKRWGLADLQIEEQHRKTVDEAIAKAIGLAAAKGQSITENLKADVKNQTVAQIANTVIASVPGTVKALGIEDRIEQMVLSRLGIMAVQQTTGVVPPGLPQPPPAAAPPPAPAPVVNVIEGGSDKPKV